MIKLPKEVNKIMKTLESEGFAAFTVGECVRDSLVGKSPYGWDIGTSARFEDLTRLFPEAHVISEKFSAIRMDFIEETIDEDGDFAGEEGIIVDVTTFRKGGEAALTDGSNENNSIFADTVEEDLGRRIFTINAIADSPNKIVDIYEGREDIRRKLVRTIGEAEIEFKESPVRMLKAVRIAAELGFDLHKNVYEAIVANYKLLGSVNVDRIRNEFTKLISAEYAGKGLGMLMDTGMLDIILGEDIVSRLSRREMSDLTVLCQNIDKTKQVEDRRLGLFFTCMDKKKAMPAIERLGFDEGTYQHLYDAVHDMAKLYFAAQKTDLKRFIYKRGWDRYNYLANLEKAQRIVFDYYSETKIKSKMYLLDEIKAYREPIFVEEMAIDGNDLIEAGILQQGEDVDKMLGMLAEELHVHPKKNTRQELLTLAKKYKKSKLAALTRGIHWSR